MYVYSRHEFLTPPRIAGLRMVPFTLGHVDVLTATGHAAFSGEGQGQAADLALLLFICSRPWKKAARQIRNGAAKREMRRLGRRFRRGGVAAVRLAAKAAEEYVEVYSLAPPRWETPGGNKTLCAPWHLAAFAILQEKTNFKPLEVWNLPVSTVLELIAVIGANQGDTSLVTQAEMAVFRQMSGVGDQESAGDED